MKKVDKLQNEIKGENRKEIIDSFEETKKLLQMNKSEIV